MTAWNNFSENDWNRIEKIWTSWWDGSLQRPIIIIESNAQSSDLKLADTNPHLTQFSMEEPIEPIIGQIGLNKNRLDYSGDAFPRWHPNFGTGFLAVLLGSQPEFVNGTTWFHPFVTNNFNIMGDEVREDNPWVVHLKKYVFGATSSWKKFVLGHTDIGGNLDLLASLRGSQQTLLDLIENPNEVKNWLSQITIAWKVFFNLYETFIPTTQVGRTGWAPIWAPGTTYMLQCDFSAMISKKMFQEFVIPDLDACCDYIDFPFYHLDGPDAIRHIDSLLNIKKLRGIQWIPGAGAAPVEEWMPILEKIRSAGKLCQLFCSVEGAIKISKAIGGQGFAFCIGDGTYPSPEERNTCLDYFF